jgi:hypothetical protein
MRRAVGGSNPNRPQSVVAAAEYSSAVGLGWLGFGVRQSAMTQKDFDGR